MQSSSSEKFLLKPLKIAIFGPNLCKKRGQYGPHPKQTKSFFAEMTKADHKLSKTFYFIKISYVLAELWMFFYFMVMFFFAKKGHFQPWIFQITKICMLTLLPSFTQSADSAKVTKISNVVYQLVLHHFYSNKKLM